MSRASSLLCLCFVISACTASPLPPEQVAGDIPFTPVRPTLPGSRTVTPYEGTQPLVHDAQDIYPTGDDLYRKFVLRSCGPLAGVCHSAKEYPDMHTPGSFFALIGADCNVQPGSWSTVFDRCERLGDRFRFEDSSWNELEIGWIERVTGDDEAWDDDVRHVDDELPGLHVHLAAPVPGDETGGWWTSQFIRRFTRDGETGDVTFASYRSNWRIAPDRTHLVARVSEYQHDELVALTNSGLVQGDMNRNGVFGARTAHAIAMLNPGKPEESYLVGRLRGELQGARVPGSRMPLANQPPSVPDLVALYCFIEGLSKPEARADPAGPIDFANCSYVDDPGALNLVGNGVTWKGRVKPALAAHCGGCHGGERIEGGLDLTSDDAWTKLQAASKQKPTMKLIQPGAPERSYLYLKLTGDGAIVGARMPLDPLGGVRELPSDVLADLETWIVAGALEEE